MRVGGVVTVILRVVFAPAARVPARAQVTVVEPAQVHGSVEAALAAT